MAHLISQYGIDQQVEPFGYTANFTPDHSHGQEHGQDHTQTQHQAQHQTETAQPSHAGQPILDHGDQSHIDRFFANPDQLSANNLLFNQGYGIDGGIQGGSSGLANDYMTSSIGAGARDVASSSSNDFAQATHGTQHQTLDFDTMNNLSTHGQGDSNDVLAANLLRDMSAHGQHNQSQTPITGMNNFSSSSWGNMDEFGAVTRCEGVMSGVRSANHSQTGTHGFSNAIQNGGYSYPTQAADPNLHSPFGQFYQNPQPHQQIPSNFRRPHSGSISANGLPNNYRPGGQQSPISTSHYLHQGGRPSLTHAFGSDPNFRGPGYFGQGFNMAAPQQTEKAGNLMNVPLAHQAAASGHALSHGQEGTVPHSPYADIGHFSSGPQSRQSLNSSPGSHPGQPASSLVQNQTQHAYQQADAKGKGRMDFASSNHDQPRKRRKSQVEREDEAEYMPPPRYGQQQMNSRGGGRVAKIESTSDDEEGGLPVKTQVKRRKSTVTSNRDQSIVSEDATASTAASKKKAREAKLRTNLSDGQKRQNHIQSEQKRRNVIKEAYEDLQALVPGLVTTKAGVSKADSLTSIISFIESTNAGNAAMLEKLGLNNVANANIGGNDNTGAGDDDNNGDNGDGDDEPYDYGDRGIVFG